MKLDLGSLMKQVGEKRAQIEAKSGKNAVVKPPQGKSRWRILPGWRPGEELTFYHDFAQHWIKEPNPAGGKPLIVGVFTCDEKTFGKPCDACNELARVKMGLKSVGLDKESGPWKMIDDMRGGLVVLVNALRRDGETKSDTPMMLGLPETAFKKYLTLLTTRGENGTNILDLDAGKDIIIERTGSGMNDTEYSVTDVEDKSAVPHAVMQSLVNIDAYIAGERQKGMSKMACLAPATQKVLALGGGGGATFVIPSAASLVPARPAPSRVIEADEVPFAAAPVAALAAPVTQASAPVQAAPVVQPVVAPVAVSDALLGDDELQAMLANL